MHEPTRYRHLSYSLIVAALIQLCAQPALGCWNADREAAADSPAWWTLSDEITPEDLRRRCLDVDDHQLRYLEAVRDGHALDLQDRLKDLVIYVDGSQTPELVPAWRAFVSFATDLESWPELAAEAAIRELANRGIDQGLTYRVLDFADQRNLRLQELEEEVEEDFMRLEALSAAARKVGRFGDFKAAAKRGDAAALARQTGATPAQIERGLRARRLRPEEVSAVEAIVALRELLDDAEWAALRSFLLERVAVGLKGVGFETEQEQ